MNVFKRLKNIDPQLLKRLKIIGLGLAALGGAIVITQLVLSMARVNARCHSAQASAILRSNKIVSKHE